MMEKSPGGTHLRLEPLPGLIQFVKGHLHLLVGVVCGLQLLGQLLAALVGLLQGRRVVLRLLLGISQLQMQATKKYIHVYYCISLIFPAHD